MEQEAITQIAEEEAITQVVEARVCLTFEDLEPLTEEAADSPGISTFRRARTSAAWNCRSGLLSNSRKSTGRR